MTATTATAAPARRGKARKRRPVIGSAVPGWAPPARQASLPGGVVVRPGQVWRDCDPRMGNRTAVVVSVSDDRAAVRSDTGRVSSVLLWRMRPGARGWELVRDAAPPRDPVGDLARVLSGGGQPGEEDLRAAAVLSHAVGCHRAARWLRAAGGGPLKAYRASGLPALLVEAAVLLDSSRDRGEKKSAEKA